MTDFAALSKDVLAGFLQTVVVIDDQAYDVQNEKTAIPLKSPSRGQAKADDSSEDAARTQVAHSLDTSQLVSAFACKGLVCAVIAPQKDEPVEQRLGSVVDRCDIVIIDWQMFNDDGKQTLSLIKHLCEGDCGNRLRLLCVYSGEPDLEKISDQITGKKFGFTCHDNNKLLLRKDHVIVTILGKSVVPVERLADELFNCFSIFTRGLLSNAVLAALTGIRRNTHRIIQKFDSSLDQAYISHRILSVPVDNSESEILSVICSELESAIHQSPKIPYINSGAIQAWMKSDARKNFNYDELNVNPNFAPQALEKLIEFGINHSDHSHDNVYQSICSKVRSKKFVKESKMTLILGGKKPKDEDRRFAILSTLETRYEDYVPKLTLGSIVHDGERYLLCILPRCDSARVPTKGRNFLFIQLVDKSPPQIDIIVKDNNNLVDLGISMHPYDTIIIRFAASTAGQPVKAVEKDGSWVFKIKSEDDNVETVRWVADVKPQVAQAFANEYASKVSRVGVNKSQWLHQLANKE
ncbi:response regulator receiver domain [Megalodesulfovibrio gigas]|uniref:Response receiver domain-containing protein n=1 Tax=Megalodesulfovibrio gigas (strain ATCC 19364 / DSM 1382 / NCIMB 9332 / VKM B-1759) TaxID=1121448 RepID=T2GB31_MEGG1|nr:response regulator receiver domain [Megalodesulfovibrio gigas]AGW13795.1 hypothetical protein DGI_2022 [Megalodesulfovibrio gigas DSM 1382 = ATCC 19364]